MLHQEYDSENSNEWYSKVIEKNSDGKLKLNIVGQGKGLILIKTWLLIVIKKIINGKIFLIMIHRAVLTMYQMTCLKKFLNTFVNFNLLLMR